MKNKRFSLNDRTKMNKHFNIALFFFLSPILLFSQQNYNPFQLSSSVSNNIIYKPNAVVPDFQVNENVGSRGARQLFPRITSHSWDHFTIVWIDQRQSKDLLYKGTVTEYAHPYRPYNSKLNDSINLQFNYRKSFDVTSARNSYVVTWVSAKTKNVYAQRYKSGYHENKPDIPIGNIFQVNDIPKPIIYGSFGYPSAASIPGDGFIIVFVEMVQGIGTNIYMQRYTPIGTKLGQNVKVNNDSTDYQNSMPAISTDAKGNFIITWLSNPWGGSGSSVRAQRFKKDGTPIGTNFKVDQITHNINHYSEPDIAVTDSGNFIIVWNAQYIAADSVTTNYSLYAQLYSKDGSKIDSNFVVNNDGKLTNRKTTPQVEVGKYDKFIITWAEHRVPVLGNDIYLQLYNENGLPIGTNYLVNDARQGVQSNPAISVNPNGYFVITWNDGRKGFEYDEDIYAQMFKPDGTRFEVNFKLNDDVGSSNQQSSSISVNDNGNFIIAWSDYRDEDICNVYAQKYLNDGTAICNNFKVSDIEGSSLGGPAIEVNGTDNFLIAWVGSNKNGWDENVFLKKFHSNGDVLHKFNISNRIAHYKYSVDLSCDSVGNYFIAWEGLYNPGSISYNYYNIYLQRYTADGSLYGSPQKVNDDNVTEPQRNPAIGANKKGDFSIAWEDRRNSTYEADIYAQPFSNADYGTPLGSNIKVNDDEGSFSHLQPDTDIDNAGNFVITWKDNRNLNFDIFAQRYSADGIPLNTNVMINDDTSNTNKHSPSIAFNNDGKYVIVWVSWLIDSWAVLGQRFLNDGTRIGNNFLITKTSFTNSDMQIISPRVKLHSNLIYTTWEDNRADGTGLDIWANVLDWDQIVGITNQHIINKPDDYLLLQNYPNPFNGTTQINYTIPANDNYTIKLTIFNLLGQQIRKLVDGKQQAGSYNVMWNGKDDFGNTCSSGIYLYKIKAGTFQDVKKMIFLE